MPRRFIDRLSPAASWGSAPSTIQLAPRPYLITAILMDLKLNITTGATPGTTQDAYARLFSGMSLVGDSGRNFISISDGRPVHFENKLFMPEGSKFVAQTVPGASQTGVTRRQQLLFHFGSRPVSPDGTYNPYDMTAGIPAGQSQLTLTINWAPQTNLGSGWTLNAGTVVDLTIYGIQPKDGEAPIKSAMVPLLTTNAFQPPNTSASLGVPYQVPQSHFWHSSMVLSLAGSSPADNRSDAALADISLRVPKDGNARLATWNWGSFAANTGKGGAVCDDDGTTFGTPTVGAGTDAGVGRIDLTTIGGNVNQLYGLDMRSMDPGDVVIDMGVNTVGNVVFLHRFYDPA